MTKEIRKETGFWGGEKQVLYENGAKVGEVRHEESFIHELTGGLFGSLKDVTYNNSGKRVSETTYGHGIINNVSITKDVNTGETSKTYHNQGIFENRDDIYQNGEKIGSSKSFEPLVGRNYGVVKDASGHDVDLTTRREREKKGYNGSQGRELSETGRERAARIDRESRLEKEAKENERQEMIRRSGYRNKDGGEVNPFLDGEIIYPSLKFELFMRNVKGFIKSCAITSAMVLIGTGIYYVCEKEKQHNRESSRRIERKIEEDDLKKSLIRLNQELTNLHNRLNEEKRRIDINLSRKIK